MANAVSNELYGPQYVVTEVTPQPTVETTVSVTTPRQTVPRQTVQQPSSPVVSDHVILFSPTHPMLSDHVMLSATPIL